MAKKNRIKRWKYFTEKIMLKKITKNNENKILILMGTNEYFEPIFFNYSIDWSNIDKNNTQISLLMIRYTM